MLKVAFIHYVRLLVITNILSEKEKVSLCVGDKVNHKKFGKGIVTSVEEGKQFNVDFENGGSKTLIWGVFDMGIVQKV